MNDKALYLLHITVDENDVRTMPLTDDQAYFYSGKLPTHCSRSRLFAALEKVQQSRPQQEIEFFEKIALQTKNEFYEVSIEAIPVVQEFGFSSANSIYKDIRIKPEKNRPLVLICYDNTIVSPVRYCGEHFHVFGNSGVRPNTIYKWAYEDQFFNQLGIDPIDPNLAKKIDDQVKTERSAESDSKSNTTIIDVIIEVLKDISNEKPKPPFH